MPAGLLIAVIALLTSGHSAQPFAAQPLGKHALNRFSLPPRSQSRWGADTYIQRAIPGYEPRHDSCTLRVHVYRRWHQACAHLGRDEAYVVTTGRGGFCCVPGRYQGRDVALDKGALVREAQLGLAAVMADRVPPLMGLHLADRGDAHPAAVGVGVAHHCLRTVDEHQPGTSSGPDQPSAAG